MFIFIFGEYRQFIIQIAGGEQHIFHLRETEGAKLCCEPLFIFPGMVQIALHDVPVQDKGCGQVLVFRLQIQVGRRDGSLLRFRQKAEPAVSLQDHSLQL